MLYFSHSHTALPIGAKKPLNVPRRTDSLPSSRSSTPSGFRSTDPIVVMNVEDDLRDARRVQTHGQEEDLRQALSNMIGKVEEFSALLKDAYKTQNELETQLTLAKSNLQLALANNEMLEDALKRDSAGRSKDIGWRRWSEREGSRRDRIEEERPRSVDYPITPGVPTLSPATTNHNHNTHHHHHTHPPSPVNGRATPTATQEGSFFNFLRVGTSTTSSANSTPVHSPSIGPPHADAHFMSASMPSLPSVNQREEVLTAQLEAERKAHMKAEAEKAELEAEIESLSQALFEEANKMVATERIKRAETEEELREIRQEKEALRSALRLVEGENGRLRSGSTSKNTSEASASFPPSPTHSSPPSSSRGAITKSLSPPPRGSQSPIQSPPPRRVAASPSPPPLPRPPPQPLDNLESHESVTGNVAKSETAKDEVEATIQMIDDMMDSSSPVTPSYVQHAVAGLDDESPWAEVRSSSPATPSAHT